MRHNHLDMLPYAAFKPLGKMLTLFGKSDPPPPPDYSGVAAANEKSAQLAADSAAADLKFRTQVYNEGKPRTDALYDMANQIARKQSDAMDVSAKVSADNTNYYNNSFKPIEGQTVMNSMGGQNMSAEDASMMSRIMNGTSGLSGAQITDAMNRINNNSGNNAANQASQAAQAQSNSAFTQQSQSLARMGLDPSRLASAAAGLAQNQTLANTGAANNARNSAFAQQNAAQTGVANFGRNMPNTAGVALAQGVNAGSAAVGSQSAAANAGLSNAQFMSGAYGTGINAANTGVNAALGMGNIMGNDYQARVQAASQQGGALGGMFGLAGSLGSAAIMSSDRSLKENIKKVGVLDSGLPLYTYTYKLGYDLPEGAQFGVMADEAELLFPDAVTIASNGFKQVDYARVV